MVTMDTLPPFSGDDTRCTKCGNTQASTTYRGEGERSLGDFFNPTRCERLDRVCQRCRYAWSEAIATRDQAAPFRGRVPLGQQFSVELVFVGELSPGETHVQITHKPSGLHQALSCVNAGSAKAAETPLLMFQSLLDSVDAWQRQPIEAI